jgi:hypothetical protein
MNKEIKAAQKNFHDGQIPEMVEKFYEFAIANSNCRLFDYETISDNSKYLESYISKNVAKEFLPFYTDRGHGVYAFWVNKSDVMLSDSPVVYFDSEGLHTVCASNFGEFVYLFSRDLVYTISHAWISFFENESFGIDPIPPGEQYDGAALSKLEQKCKSKFSCYENFKFFVTNDLKISPSIGPVEMVERAIKNNPVLLDYLKKNDGLK